MDRLSGDINFNLVRIAILVVANTHSLEMRGRDSCMLPSIAERFLKEDTCTCRNIFLWFDNSKNKVHSRSKHNGN